MADGSQIEDLSCIAAQPSELATHFASLAAQIEGEVYTDRFNRGRYATDASIYQMVPQAVVMPKTEADLHCIIRFARHHGIPLLPRGGGTSQCGQTVNTAIVLDMSRHMNRLLETDPSSQTCVVEPGIVLDELNRQLKPYGLWFPVDVSTSSRATIGGMAGNNSCGGRSIRYGMMRDNVLAIEAIMGDGSTARFGALEKMVDSGERDGRLAAILPRLLEIGSENQQEISQSFPKVMRRVGGYNIDALMPDAMAERPAGKPGDGINLAHLLVGSEGTLALTTKLTLKLAPLPAAKRMAVCHFPSFYKAMDAAQHLVMLDPVAVELVDDTMLSLGRSIALFRPVIEEVVEGNPAALLLVEFAEEDMAENDRRMDRLERMMAELGFGFDKPAQWCGGIVRADDADLQSRISEMRKSGLNIMMSMKDEAKPVSFVEDCAVELKDLADYTDGLTRIFEKHGCRGTWYAHASVGCLHVRPVLNMKNHEDVATMRAIAEEAFALVRRYGGSHSGEHGDGIVRSEFNEVMFGARMTGLFKEIKTLFDPEGIFNPGKIIDAPKMDDRRLFRYAPGYSVKDFPTQLDWSAWPGAAGGFQGAVEMCNNNGACRKLAGGVMCPSYRATREERDSTRGRANTLRLAISGQLGPDAMASPAMAETMKLCVSCKACKRECPTGVDMARMKVEITALQAEARGISLRDRLIGYLPAYARLASSFAPLINLRNHFTALAWLGEKMFGLAAARKLPFWRRDWFRKDELPTKPADDKIPVILFADTFNRYFEPENLRAAKHVLDAAGYAGFAPVPASLQAKPLCCGRTYLSVGMLDQARREAARLVETLYPFAAENIPIIGLEPSCLYALRDEVPALVSGHKAETIARMAMTLEELLARDRPELALQLPGKALLHGHCHQKAFDGLRPVETVLAMIDGLETTTIDSSCCGMAGAFGYQAETETVSRDMAEVALLPAVRQASDATYILADGTSCRCQISHGSQRQAIHVARLLEKALQKPSASR